MLKNQLYKILEIQEIDIKMIRLIRLHRQRAKERDQIIALREELHEHSRHKELEIRALQDQINEHEQLIEQQKAKVKKLESQQSSVKRVDEFNALSREISNAEKGRVNLESELSSLIDKKASDEESFEKNKKSLEESETHSRSLEEEINDSLAAIAQEATALKQERVELLGEADSKILTIYERLLRNKKDRVVVALENRTCSGCHIALTAQYENLVRKGEKLVFCEHCSRILYWNESAPSEEEGSSAAPAKRRRRKAQA